MGRLMAGLIIIFILSSMAVLYFRSFFVIRRRREYRHQSGRLLRGHDAIEVAWVHGGIGVALLLGAALVLAVVVAASGQ